MKIKLKDKSPAQLFSKQLVSLKYVQHIQNDLKKNDIKKINLKNNYLNQSYIFHLIAYWQTFIERLLLEKVNKMQLEFNDKELLELIILNVKNKLKKFNTPNTENIDSLFKETLGIEKVTSSWNTTSLTRTIARKELKEILNIRHKIAHTGYSETKLDYSLNFEKMKFIFNLASILEEYVLKYKFKPQK